MDSAQLGWVLDVSEIKVATGRDKGGIGSQQIEKWAERAAQMRKYKQLRDRKMWFFCISLDRENNHYLSQLHTQQ